MLTSTSRGYYFVKVYYEFALLDTRKISESDISFLLTSRGTTSAKSVMSVFTSATDYSVYLETDGGQVEDFYNFITTQANSVLHFLNNQFKVMSGFLSNSSLVEVISTTKQKNPIFHTKLLNNLVLIVRPASLSSLKEGSIAKKTQ